MKVFEPIEINGMKIPNRLGLSSLLNNPSGENGEVTDATVKWFEVRAKGGVGLVMTGAVQPVDPVIPLFRALSLGCYDDKFIPGFARLADAIHAHGGKLGVQIAAGGPMTGTSPSPPPFPDEQHPKQSVWETLGRPVFPINEVTVEQIHRIEDAFAAAALRVKKAGADCVEIHCTHGGASLLCSFVSPFYNKRTDEYGGNWENRLRLTVETVQKVRKAVGDDYPILIRICGDQLMGKGGITIEDTVTCIVPALEKAGVDCFDVSQGDNIRAVEGISIPLYYPRGCYIYVAEAVKKVTKLPVIGVGRIVDVDMAERFLQEDKADIIFMTRQFTSDPETPNKYREGKQEDIRTCIGCLAGCGRPCPINYDIQDEPIPLIQAEKQKKVLVIGGGVGGMEAARIAALRGHKVTLMEKTGELGGMVAALSLAKMTSEFRNIVDYLEIQMRKMNIDVRVCKEATMADIEEMKPDVVIVAAGSSMVMPEVTKGKLGVMDHIEALRNQRAIGQKVVIWGLVAAELGISLAEDGKDVVMIGRGGEETLARDYTESRRYYVMRKLTDANVVRETPPAERVRNPEVMYFMDVEDIDADGIHLKNKDGAKTILPYDTLIISRERATNDSIYETLQGKASEVYKIGDCQEVGDIKTAVWSANEVARKI